MVSEWCRLARGRRGGGWGTVGLTVLAGFFGVSCIWPFVRSEGPPPAEPAPLFSRCIAAEGESTWFRLPYPDSSYEPGAILVAEACAPRLVGHLRDCHVPESVIATSTGEVGDWNRVISRRYGVEAVLGIGGVTAGPEIDGVSRVEIQQEDVQTERISVIKFELWLDEARDDGLERICGGRLQEEQTFIIGESVRVGTGRYTFHNEAGARIDGSVGVLGLEADAEADLDDAGGLVMRSPVYTHIRNLRLVGDRLEFMGAVTARSDDEVFIDILEGTGAR